MSCDNINAKPLSREVLEDFTNRCARLDLYNEGSDEYNTTLSEIFNDVYDYRQIYDYERVAKVGNKEGVKNELLGCYIVPPVFDKVIDETNAGHNYIVANDGKYGITKTNGKAETVIPCIYDSIEKLDTFCDIVKFGSCGKYGIIELYSNGLAVIAIEPLYDKITETNTSFIVLEKDGKMGLYRYGYTLPAEYDRIFIPELLGWIKVLKDGVWGYIDADNKFTERLDEAFLHNCH